MKLLRNKIALKRSRYRILGLVGQGQYGQVFCAADRQTGKLVALKALSQHRASTSEFLQELRVLLTLQHPNIVACRAVEHTATGRYLVMDYCEGGTLRDLLDRPNSLKLGDALRLVLGILAGLDCAHRQAVLHCDLKPENILLSLMAAGWLPRLSDFGIARHLPSMEAGHLYQELSQSTISAIGPPAYSAPERFYGLYSPVSDLYSVGILLFELLLGYRPFSGTPAQIMWAHVNERLELPAGVPEPLQSILHIALEKLPARRFASASQMEQALRDAIASPQLQTLREETLPLQCATQPIAPTPNSNYIAESLPGQVQATLSDPITCLATANGYLYAASDKTVRGWKEPRTPIVEMDFPERVHCLLPLSQGTLALTERTVYGFNTDSWQAQVLLHLTNDFKAALDPTGQWLAIAIAGQLQFYSLAALFQASFNDRPPEAKHRLALPSPILPELIFLDSRHLLAIASDPDQNQTDLRFYSRRGTAIGWLHLSGYFSHFVPAAEPYAAIAVEPLPHLAAVAIQLKPLQIRRTLLSCQAPTCCAIAPWGSAFADRRGQIVLLDPEGSPQGNFAAPPNPTALAPWGESSLAMATRVGDCGKLHLLDLQQQLQQTSSVSAD